MIDTITDAQLFDALNHALSQVYEHDELDAKLAVFGLEPASVHALLMDRWTHYCDEHEDSSKGSVVFVRGFVEGLLTGIQLSRRHE